MSRPKVYFKNKQSKNTSPVPPSMFESSPSMRLEGMMYSKAQGGIRDTRKKELGPPCLHLEASKELFSLYAHTEQLHEQTEKEEFFDYVKVLNIWDSGC